MALPSLDFLLMTRAALLVLLLPGAAVLAWLPRDSRPAPGTDGPGWLARTGSGLSALADVLAVSVSLTALVGMLQFFAGLHFSGWVVAALYGLCLLACIGAVVMGRVRMPAGGLARALLAALLVMLLLALMIAWRFYQARELALPSWGDPVHHTLIVRMILETGGLPADFQPYFPTPFFYHYGFHLVCALLAFWSRLPQDQAVLWFGQVINALVALSVFRVAMAVGERVTPAPAAGPLEAPVAEGGGGETEQPLAVPLFSPHALVILRALVAALLVTFCFQMPAYYLTWGRFTLLTGLLLLGPLIAAAVEAAPSIEMDGAVRPEHTAARIRLALLIAGMCLTHYFALLLAGLFLLILGLARLRRALTCAPERAVLVRLVAWSLLGVLLALPWVAHVWQNTYQVAGIRVTAPLDSGEAAMESAKNYFDYFLQLVGPRRSTILLVLASFGLVIPFRRPAMRLFAAWGALLTLLALLWGLRWGPFRPDHFAIVLFFPASVLLAELITGSGERLARLARPWVGRAAVALIVAALVAWGGFETRSILNPVTVFATSADAAALQWIEAHTPPSARFYMNTTTWLSSYRGVDGAYWLMPVTGRASLIPPLLYTSSPPAYVTQINDWGKRAMEIKGCTPEFWQIVQEAQLTHVYLREEQGGLQPSALESCPGLSLVYQHDGVYIYEIHQP